MEDKIPTQASAPDMARLTYQPNHRMGSRSVTLHLGPYNGWSVTVGEPGEWGPRPGTLRVTVTSAPMGAQPAWTVTHTIPPNDAADSLYSDAVGALVEPGQEPVEALITHLLRVFAAALDGAGCRFLAHPVRVPQLRPLVVAGERARAGLVWRDAS